MFKKYAFALTLVLVIVLTACGPKPTEAPVVATEPPVVATEPPVVAGPAVTELKILWAQWAPADYLQQLANVYEQETGIKVTVVQEPWGSFPDLFFTEMAAGGGAWDMVIGDSQWLGQGSTQGHYVNLTDFMVSNGIDKTVTPSTLQYYGEYPAASGQYWAYPTEGDALGWAYRKDLFEDPANMSAFKTQYGYDLAIPTNFAQMMDIAKFFNRPAENLYGVAIYTQKDYDALTMGFEAMMFSYGGKWQAADNTVEGVVNSPEVIAAAQYYRDLYSCCQAPGLSNAFFSEVNDAFLGGQAAMVMNYFAFLPVLASESTNPYANVTGFFANPEGPTGIRKASLGGQGMSVISYISPERQAASLDFIKWFAQESNQVKWAEFGGYTCNSNVLKTDAFLNATPYNPAFATTMTFVMDFWNIPTYGTLLEISQRNLSAFILEGQGTAKEAMDAIAAEQTAALKADGVIP
jgi:multiple sugar transport system substrate-binding protein